MLSIDYIRDYWEKRDIDISSVVQENEHCIYLELSGLDGRKWIMWQNLETQEYISVRLRGKTIDDTCCSRKIDPVKHCAHPSHFCRGELDSVVHVSVAMQVLGHWRVDMSRLLFHESDTVREFAKIFVNSY